VRSASAEVASARRMAAQTMWWMMLMGEIELW
jgi:hypothetical protein